MKSCVGCDGPSDRPGPPGFCATCKAELASAGLATDSFDYTNPKARKFLLTFLAFTMDRWGVREAASTKRGTRTDEELPQRVSEKQVRDATRALEKALNMPRFQHVGVAKKQLDRSDP